MRTFLYTAGFLLSFLTGQAQAADELKVSSTEDLQWLYSHVLKIGKNPTIGSKDRETAFQIGRSEKCIDEVSVTAIPLFLNGVMTINAICSFTITLNEKQYLLRADTYFGFDIENGSLNNGDVSWIEEEPRRGKHTLPEEKIFMEAANDLITRIVAQEKARLAQTKPRP